MGPPVARKGVHFDIDDSPIPDLPSFDDMSATSQDSSSMMLFVNAQLVAHGFTYGSGIDTDGLSDESITRLSKCLLNMLGQRTEDIKRAEDLTTKLRTLSYDYENLSSRHRDISEKAAHSEREMNVHKSRLATAHRTLQTTSLAHKNSTAELTRTRTSMQALRATHLSELRKRDKEVERMVERWSKVSDSQLKISSIGAGMLVNGARCANAIATDGSGVLLGGCKGYLDVALEEAERSRAALAEENNQLRRLLLRAVNEGQEAVHELRIAADPKFDAEQPTPLTLTTLFPLSSEDIATQKLTALFTALQASIAIFSDPNRSLSKAVPSLHEPPRNKVKADNIELDELRKKVASLTSELERTKRSSDEQARHVKALLDQIAAQEHTKSTGIPEISIELMSVPMQDEAKLRLEQMQQQLEEERARFTEATLRLGRERAEFEKDRVQFLEEKRSLEVAQILEVLPPTPATAEQAEPEIALPRRHRRDRGHASPKKSPHKVRVRSPVKMASPVKGLSISKKGRRSSLLASLGDLDLSPRRNGVVAPSFETEVLLPPPPAAFPVAIPSTGFGTITESKKPLMASTFVFPPASPMAKIPPRNGPPTTANTTSKVSFPAIEPVISLPTTASNPIPAPPLTAVSSLSQLPASSTSALTVPQTPGTSRPFPMRNIAHAYSPAKPSPLSRILMLANSPPSPPVLSTLAETDEEESSGPEISPTPAPPVSVPARGKKQMSLAAELGLPDSDGEVQGDGPLQEKQKNAEPARRTTAQEKGKMRATVPSRVAPSNKASTVRVSGAGTEKENTMKRARPTPSTVPSGAAQSKPRPGAKPPTTRPAVGTTTASKPGPRRVVPSTKRPFA